MKVFIPGTCSLHTLFKCICTYHVLVSHLSFTCTQTWVELSWMSPKNSLITHLSSLVHRPLNHSKIVVFIFSGLLIKRKMVNVEHWFNTNTMVFSNTDARVQLHALKVNLILTGDNNLSEFTSVLIFDWYTHLGFC